MIRVVKKSFGYSEIRRKVKKIVHQNIPIIVVLFTHFLYNYFFDELKFDTLPLKHLQNQAFQSFKQSNDGLFDCLKFFNK